MSIIDIVLWSLVALCAAALFYLEYLRMQLRIGDAKRQVDYEKAKQQGGAE